MVIGPGVRYGQPMTNTATFEYIAIGPDGRAVRGQQPLIEGAVPMQLELLDKEGPFALTAHYRRTGHKIEGRPRFDWVESKRVDNGATYRLENGEGLGPHGLVNDPE